MSRKWTLKYGSAAIITAIAIIAISLIANPSMLPAPVNADATFTVMLTDPPTAPAGTTVLNLTYSDVLLQVSYPNGTLEWIDVGAFGTVNLFSLVNMSQTIASTTIPLNSTVEKIQFTIDDVEAVIRETTYNVTALSSTLVIKVDNGRVNQTLSGVLLDFNPTLVQIQATDENDAQVDYYVLVPSATAIIVKDLTKEQLRVGTIVKIGENNKAKLTRVVEEFKKNVTIVSASLSFEGNTTMLSVTLKNEGEVAFRVFGITLHGEFNATQTWKTRYNDEINIGKIQPRTIPFKLYGASLVPLFGTDADHSNRNIHENEHEYEKFSSLTLQPQESITLTYSGVIALQQNGHGWQPKTIITPTIDGNYTLRLSGEGSQTYDLTISP